MNFNILPDPITCANKPGGVNSVIFDHAAGFLAAGHTINAGNDGIRIAHALAEVDNVDVYHNHGLYPIGDGLFDKSYSIANDTILRNALNAKVTICISEFSADILRHKLHINPIVTRNGIWINEYPAAGSPSGPILFPKAALDPNARPDAMLWLKDHTDYPLVSIAKIQGIKSTGPLSRQLFLEVMRECSIYLGVTKENNSMATMEAMRSGVPVVGYQTGFNSEWLVNGNGCELVPRGDLPALTDAIGRVMGNWKRYSKAAREYAEIFDWQPVINQLLGIYERVATDDENKLVSIIIPVHNYERYLSEAIQSAIAQTIPCEVIVVDDKSTDGSAAIAMSFESDGVRLIRNETNLGVAETRNRGIQQAKGEYVICLDADDRLHQNFAESHLAALRNRQDAIAYAPISIIDERGNPQSHKRMFRTAASPALQMAGKNQVPSCCMFRKSFWVRAGGYEKRFTPAEDANLWLKILSLGGIPKRASSEPLMDYRAHNQSLSAGGSFPEWWTGYQKYETPITERDTEIEIILQENEDPQNVKEILWQLKNQEQKKWSCSLVNPCPNLKQSFPWLKSSPPSRSRNVLSITPGTQLPPNFLTQYEQQTPPWMRESRSR